MPLTLQASANLRPRFDEPHLFEMYFLHHGSIPRMLDTIALLPPEQRKDYPARPTMYEYEKKYAWKQRYKTMHDAVIEKLESSVALHYDRINQIANLAASGLAKRMVDALQSGDETKMKVFTGELMKIMWELQRTERGLPTHITKVNQSHTMSSPAEDRLRARGLGKLVERIKSSPEQTVLRMLNMMGGDVAEMPMILR